jgi:urate oxidase
MTTVSLVDHGYGKAGVRVAKVEREGVVHRFYDLTLDIRLEGDFSPSYLVGDNSTSLPTDTMRLMAYVVAQQMTLAEPERYAEALLRALLAEVPVATGGRVGLVEHSWERLVVDGAAHPHSFRRAHGVGTATVEVTEDGPARVVSGLDELVLLKTTASEYNGFLTNAFTVLRETDDRILSTSVDASWTFGWVPASYTAIRVAAQQCFEHVFATHHSKAVQETLTQMATALLEAASEVASVTLRLPNRHHVPVDLAAVGRSNDNEVFVVLDRPFGLIEATVTRA